MPNDQVHQCDCTRLERDSRYQLLNLKQVFPTPMQRAIRSTPRYFPDSPTPTALGHPRISPTSSDGLRQLCRVAATNRRVVGSENDCGTYLWFLDLPQAHDL